MLLEKSGQNKLYQTQACKNFGAYCYVIVGQIGFIYALLSDHQ